MSGAILRDCPNTAEECHEIIFGVEDEAAGKSQDQRKSIQQRNAIRQEIRSTFESEPQTWCLPKIIGLSNVPENYRDCGFQPYIDKIDELRTAIGRQLVEPKQYAGKALTCGMVSCLMPELATALAVDDPSINPPGMVEAVLQANWARISDDVKNQVKGAVQK